MLLNGYLVNRAILQQKYKQKQESFQTLIPINKMHKLSIRLLEPNINTFDKDNIKEIQINQKKIHELKQEKEYKKEEKKEDKKEENKKEEKEEDYELLDIEDIHVNTNDKGIKKIKLNISQEDIQKMDQDDIIPDLKEEDIPDLKQDTDDEDIPDLKQATDEEDIPELKQENVKQIGGEVTNAVKNVVVSFF